MAKAVRAGMKALDLALFAEEGFESNTLTAVKYPSGIEDNAFRKTMQKHGVLVAGGQAHLKGKIFRVAHMNLTGEKEVLLTLAVAEYTLKELGFDCEGEEGVSVVEEIFLKSR